MPRRRNKSLKNSKEPVADATADCVLPEDIMISILTRLPVKSILRFKSVCKPWRHLFSTPEFMEIHYAQGDSKTLIFQDIPRHTMFLFEIESDEKKPRAIDHPYPEIERDNYVDFVGCCNGLICRAVNTLGRMIHLLNPATKSFKFVPLSNSYFGPPKALWVSMGFGYDAERHDFKVVRIVYLKEKMEKIIGVEVYSGNSQSWITINVDFQFRVSTTKCRSIVNGNPYWSAEVDKDECDESRKGRFLVCFDMKRMVFKFVPLPKGVLVDWNGSLGALRWDVGRQRNVCLDVWVFDDIEQMWRKKHNFGPLLGRVGSFLLCLKNGNILGYRPDSELFVFDPKDKCGEDIRIDDDRRHCFEVYGYTESLACVKGMKQDKGGKRKRKRGHNSN